MRHVRPGDRGPAVEDIQRRLLVLGHDLGRTGVDGVFLGATAEAVRAFQQVHGLSEDGIVGEETWSALVDSTFTLGDRVLYLRMPYFHGRDVRELQSALNALGFACGEADGIFGAFAEHALREFQRNAGLPADGIAGADTVRAIMNLRHVWEGKDSTSHSAARTAPARAVDVLERVDVSVGGLDEPGEIIAYRVVNLAEATAENACVRLVPASREAASCGSLTVLVSGGGTARASSGRPAIAAEPYATFVDRLLAALPVAEAAHGELVVEFGEDALVGEHAQQRAAVLLLDALCAAFD